MSDVTAFTCPHGFAVRPGTDYSLDQCRPCWLDAGGAVGEDAGPAGVPPRTGFRLDCAHRGPKLRSLGAGCGACTVFACDVHGECLVAPRPEGGALKTCRDCDRYRSKRDAPTAPARPEFPQAPVVSLDGGGIGDALCAVAVAAGFGGRTVVRPPPSRREWVELFADVVAEELPLKLEEYGATDRRVPRWEWWAGRAGVAARLPAPRPLPADALAWAVPYAGRVALAPFAAHANRTWPLDRWVDVERALLAAGFGCVVLDDGRPERTAAFRSDVLRGERPARVAAVIHFAAAFAGNDSGMAHVAGFCRTPAVAVCSRASDPRIFDLYPTVRQLGGRRAGFEKVAPADVAGAVLAQARASLGDFPADEFAGILADRDVWRMPGWLPIYAALWREAKAIAPRRVVEIGTRAGYSAWTFLRACPDATVAGFDANLEEHGGYVGANEHARRILDPARFELTVADSHALDRLPPCDLAYVDGDHTEAGALADLELCARSGVPVVLLDDVTNLPDVRRAGDRFCAARGLTPRFIPSRTGMYRIDLPRP